ncbi:hypothetical protein DYU11_28165 [Fibrisoma montanum]|uniref:DUF2961 domain-containing protein n=1 Tax=Fibrisoma montanum TaxID=2305895 RepID=A0A418LZ02_9BACT|nr:hypothetical protein [Fibrisoma montanum]RIV18452.1 hypothetical protein DYU11_28165 [Fibrisoma montanum]
MAHPRLLCILLIFCSCTVVWGQITLPCQSRCVAYFVKRGPYVPKPPVQKPPPPSDDEPFTYPVPSEQTEWNGYNTNRIHNKEIGKMFTQESDALRIEVRKEYGASLQIYDKVTNQYLINFFDQGRESGMSSYSGVEDIPFSDDSPRWKGIGYNPLQAGDDGGNPAPILYQGIVNGWIYTKAQCLSWPHMDARLLPFFYEQWVKLKGNKVHVKVRLTHRRGDNVFHNASQQEWPMMMINGAKTVRFYNGSQPFTGAPTAATNAIERRNGDDYVLHQGTPFGQTEPWQGVEIGANRLIGLYCPGFYRASYNVAVPWLRDDWEGGNTMTYISNHPMVHLDSENVWLKEYTYVVGTEQQVREFVYAQPRQNTPDFHFRKADGRNGWFIWDGGYDQKEPFVSDNWKVTFTGKTENGVTNAWGSKLMSGYHSFKASEFNSVYIRMAYSGPQTQLHLTWLLNGQAPDGMDPSYPNQNSLRFPKGVRDQNQFVVIPVINDGKMHTYKVSFAGHPMWKDIIQQFEITHGNAYTFLPPGEVIELNYLGVNNPGN